MPSKRKHDSEGKSDRLAKKQKIVAANLYKEVANFIAKTPAAPVIKKSDSSPSDDEEPVTAASSPSPPTTQGPSRDWDLDLNPRWKKVAVQSIIDKAKWPYLFSQAAKRHPSGQPPICNFTTYAAGAFNAIFELAFPDGTFWIARVRIPPLEQDEVGDPETDMVCEIATMRLVASRTTIPVPKVFDHDHRDDGPFRYPYMLMSVLPGASPTNHLSLCLPDDHKTKVASQLASVIHQLSTITFPQTGSIWTGYNLSDLPSVIRLCNIEDELGPFSSSLADLTATRQRYNREIRDGHWDDGDAPWEEEWKPICEAFTGTISTALVSSAHRRGPFPLTHFDLHPGNMLFDDDWNLTGIIDWTGARAAPVECFIALGEICVRNDCPGEKERAWVREFKEMFVEAFERLEGARGGGMGLTRLFSSRLPQAMYHWLEGNFINSADTARGQADRLVTVVYGEGTTVGNWRERERKGLGKGFRRKVEGPSRYEETRVRKGRKRR